MVGWGFDPIYFSSRRMLASDLDRVSDDRPVIVMHASGHMLNANGFILKKAGVSSETDVDGIVKDDTGQPTGELQELAAMFMAFEVADIHPFEDMGSARSLRYFAAVSRRAGVTTVTDLYSALSPQNVADMLEATSQETFPVRLVASGGESSPRCPF